MFGGEEFLRAVRFGRPPRLTARLVPLGTAVSAKPRRYFTYGYNLYSPSENVLFHYYGRCAA